MVIKNPFLLPALLFIASLGHAQAQLSPTPTPTPTRTPIEVTWNRASSDAVIFKPQTGQTSVIFNDKIWIIGGYSNHVWSSSDGLNWKPFLTGAFRPSYSHASLVFNDKIWVIGGGNRKGDVWFSADGTNWRQATSQAGIGLRSGHTGIVYDNKMWIIGGYAQSPGDFNDVWCSSDGTTWTEATAHAAFSPRSRHTSLVFDNKMWVIGGRGGGNARYNDVWWSSDGIIWNEAVKHASFSPRNAHSSVVFDNKMWIIGGNSENVKRVNDVWWSSDGEAWTQATSQAAFIPREAHNSIVFDNRIWVMGGYWGRMNATKQIFDIWWSRDGTAWEHNISRNAISTFGPRAVFHDKLWIVGGSSHSFVTNGVWRSNDGANWTLVTPHAGFSPRTGHTSVVFNDKIWIIGGSAGSSDPPLIQGTYHNDVWCSADGATWTLATASAAFPPRAGHMSVIFDNKIWVMGGNSEIGNLKDVWWSGDGINWVQASGIGSVIQREGSHTLVVFNNKLWIDGVWSSSNGTTWTRSTVTSGFTNRFSYNTIVFDNKLWVFGGYEILTAPAPHAQTYYVHKNYNDLWWSIDGESWQKAISQNAASPTAFWNPLVAFNDRVWLLDSGLSPFSVALWCSAFSLAPLESSASERWLLYE